MSIGQCLGWLPRQSCGGEGCISLLYNEISPSRMMPEGRRWVGHPNLFRDRSPEMIQDPIQFAPGVRPHPYSPQKIQNQKKPKKDSEPAGVEEEYPQLRGPPILMGPGLGRPGKNGGNQTSIITAPVSPRATCPPERTYTEKVHAAI